MKFAGGLVDRQNAVLRSSCDRVGQGIALGVGGTEHGVVIYREVHMGDEQLLAFSRMLGTLVVQPTGERRHPEIQTITLDPAKTNALLASYRQGNFHWHIDGATDELPQKATLLTAREVDPAGGDTEFANTYAAYAALSEAERNEIAGLQVDLAFFSHVTSQGQTLATRSDMSSRTATRSSNDRGRGLLRFEPPGPHVARYVTEDIDFHGQLIPAGSALLLMLASANRDERHFDDPDRFDIHRKPGGHLTFGRGAHFCFGAPLARLEGRIALDEVLNRFPKWDIDIDACHRSRTSTVRGWDTMPATVS